MGNGRNSFFRLRSRRGVPHEEDSDSVRSVRACGRSDGADGAAAAGRNAGRLRKRCRNAFRQIHRTRARYVGQVRLEARPGRSLRPRRVQPDRYGERHARRRALGHTEYRGTARAYHRSGEIAGSSEGFLRESAKSDYGTFRQRPAGTGETVRKRHDEAGRADAASRRSTRASGAVDRVRAQQRRGSALVEVGAPRGDLPAADAITILRIQRNLATGGQDGKPEKENRVLMSGIWISAATIARFAAAGSLMTLMAGGQSAPKAARTIVEQTSYFALPGKAEDVYPRRNATCTNPRDSCRWEAP